MTIADLLMVLAALLAAVTDVVFLLRRALVRREHATILRRLISYMLPLTRVAA